MLKKSLAGFGLMALSLGFAQAQLVLPDPSREPGRLYPMPGNDTRPFHCVYAQETQEGISLVSPETRLIVGPYTAPCHNGVHHLGLRNVSEGRFKLRLEYQTGAQWDTVAEGHDITYHGPPGSYRVVLENQGPAPRPWTLEMRLPRSQIRRP